MSHANVEILKQAIDAFSRGGSDAMAAKMDPHILVRTDPRWPEQRIYGREAVIAFLLGTRESVGPDNRIEEIVDPGDLLLVRHCWIMRGEHSGVEGELRFSEIATFREGRRILIEFFLEREQALEALGGCFTKLPARHSAGVRGGFRALAGVVVLAAVRRMGPIGRSRGPLRPLRPLSGTCGASTGCGWR